MMTPYRLIQTLHEIKTRRMAERPTLDALTGALAAFVQDSRDVLHHLPHLSSPIHDHSHNVGAVAGLLGQCQETKYRVLDRSKNSRIESIRDGRVRLEAASTSRLEGTYVTPLVDDDERQLHCMSNPSRDSWAATVHVYLEAMRVFNIYHATERTALFAPVETPLWLDTHGLWRHWPRPLALAA